MMSRRIIAAFLALLILFAAAGCQLAREDMAEAQSSDRLIGVLITKEYLDLFDFESYLNDNIHKLSAGGSITLDGDTKKYEGRLYATLVTRTLTDPETGSPYEITEFAFEGVEGIPYFCATVQPAGEEHSYTTTGAGDAISDAHTKINSSDEEESISLEGTIYFASAHSNTITCHINPVFQSPDGRVYATAGSGFMSSGDQGVGTVFSRTLEGTSTITENGKKKTTHSFIKISLASMLPPKRIVVLQMDEDNSVLSRTEYNPGQLPDTLALDRKAAFLIVETHNQDQEGTWTVSRSLYDKSNESLESFYVRDDGYCVKQRTKLDWDRD